MPKNNKRKGALVLIADKPPVGDSTTLMLYTAKIYAVDNGEPTAYFSLGTSCKDIVNQVIAIATGIDLEKITAGKLTEDEWKQIDELMPTLSKAPLYLDDTTDTTLDELKRKLTDLVTDKGVSVAIIDHAQLITKDEQHPTTDSILDDLHILAQRLEIHILAVVDE